MAAKDKIALWDPYETSHKREFFYRPSSNTEFTLPATSKTFRDCYSPSGPVGPSGYSEDFCWKAVSKPECIRTGSASGQRRNNPHPSQGFLTWRLSKGASQSSAGGSRFTSEEEIRKALTAQYCSTYRTDFLGPSQGSHLTTTWHGAHRAHWKIDCLLTMPRITDVNHKYKCRHRDPQRADHITSYREAGVVPLRSRQQDPHWTHTEMRDNYCRPKLKDQLQDNRCVTAYGGNACHRVHCRGIVPTVVQRHIRDRHDVSELTTYDTFFGRKASVVPYVLKALQPQELQQLCKVLPEKDTALMKSLMSKAAGGPDARKERKLPVVTMPASRPLEWISSWPGPH